MRDKKIILIVERIRLFLFFLISILLLIAYISATKKYVRLPNKKTKKNMDIYYPRHYRISLCK